jgi:hypothetical protein
MAQSHKFKDLESLKEVFPDVPWRASAGGKVWVFDAKAEEYVEVTQGDYVVSIGDRYEVSDSKPESAKAATAPKKTEAKAEDTDESEAKPNASAVSDAGGIESGVATKTNE